MRSWRNHADFALYMITDAACDLDTTLRDVDQALAGGVSVVQLRRPGADRNELKTFALALKSRLEPAGVPLIINDDPHLARLVDAAGVHVGQNDAAVDHARRIVGNDRLVGLSITAPDQLARVPAGVVDYLGAGPVWPTTSKGDAAPPLGPDGLRQICGLSALPVVAIGGITVENAGALAACGVRGICVVSALSRARDPKRTARQLRATVSEFG